MILAIVAVAVVAVAGVLMGLFNLKQISYLRVALEERPLPEIDIPEPPPPAAPFYGYRK